MINNIPDKTKCIEILQEYGTPKHVQAHCTAVSEVAVSLGKKLNENGFTINIPLLEAACLLHDIARVHDKHEEVGAAYLKSIGYDEIAYVVAQHTKYNQFSDLQNINEIDLLCIGDRTVKEDKYVGIDERMEYIKQKAIRMGREKFIEGIEKSKVILRGYIGGIEDIIGISLDELMKGSYE